MCRFKSCPGYQNRRPPQILRHAFFPSLLGKEGKSRTRICGGLLFSYWGVGLEAKGAAAASAQHLSWQGRQNAWLSDRGGPAQRGRGMRPTVAGKSCPGYQMSKYSNLNYSHFDSPSDPAPGSLGFHRHSRTRGHVLKLWRWHVYDHDAQSSGEWVLCAPGKA
jgi:hypothetical protein